MGKEWIGSFFNVFESEREIELFYYFAEKQLLILECLFRACLLFYSIPFGHIPLREFILTKLIMTFIENGRKIGKIRNEKVKKIKMKLAKWDGKGGGGWANGNPLPFFGGMMAPPMKYSRKGYAGIIPSKFVSYLHKILNRL